MQRNEMYTAKHRLLGGVITISLVYGEDGEAPISIGFKGGI
jgi:hypothetical protein